MSRQVLIVSDTHAFLDPRIAELGQGCDLAIHAGDIGSIQVLDELKRICGEVFAVRGNNDVRAKWPAREQAALPGLPWDLEIDLPGGILGLVHGHKVWDLSDRHGRLRGQFPGARAVVYGHSHTQCVDSGQQPWVLNPGAGGRQLTRSGPGCLVLHAGIRDWHVDSHRFDPLPARAHGE
ncbi:MAG: metallophosphatase family protein [Gammaproteobacteria bacterium]|jgi:hypothetical protein|nr:metallophosphatase family protein [Gammaproteobacteria bacterium]